MSGIYVEDPVTWGSTRAFLVFTVHLDDNCKHYGLEVGTPVYPTFVKNAIIDASLQFLQFGYFISVEGFSDSLPL